MKVASQAALAILATRQYLLAQLFDITVPTGQVYRFTDFQIPLNAAIYPSTTKNLYSTGLTIKRGTITQRIGTQSASMKLTLAPQWDSASAPVDILGYPLLQAARLGLFDGVLVQLSILVMNYPTLGQQVSTSPGAFGMFLGTVQQVEPSRLKVDLTVDDYLAYMSTQQMPRNVFQVGCYHQVYDAGCTLLRSNFTNAGSVTSVTDGAHFNTNLASTFPNYFALGVLTFTSGANNGLSGFIQQFSQPNGLIVMGNPFPVPPSPGDTFNAIPGCDKLQSTCQLKFNNLPHFGGTPYIPVPETMFDGGTDLPIVQDQGSQAGQIIGGPGTAVAPHPGPGGQYST